MESQEHDAIAAEVFAALENGTLDLPTLPDMALKIRGMMDDPNVSAEAIIRLLSTDPVLSAQVIKTANSAAFSNGNPVSDLRAAISRLGYRMLHNMVISISMNQLFKAKSPLINQTLKKLWDHSREVAANSYVLALHQKHLKPEQAMLAGLIHNLGALPLCTYAQHRHLQLDQAALDELIRKFHIQVGIQLLESWHFSHDMVEVVAQHGNLQRTTEDDKADYTDIVTIANLMMPAKAKFVAWENVRAASRFGYSPSQCQNFLTTHAEQLSVAREMLGITTPQPTSAARTPQASMGTPPSPSLDTDNKPDNTGVLSGLLKIFK